MSTVLSRLIVSGILFVVIFASGFLVSRSGRPLNAGLLALHKLAAVAAFVILVLATVQLNRQSALTGSEIALLGAAAALFVATVGTGGALSTDKPMPGVVLAAHRFAPYLTLALTIIGVYLVAHARVALT